MSEHRSATLAWLRRVLDLYYDGHPVVAPVTALPAGVVAQPRQTATVTLTVTNGADTVTHVLHQVDLSGTDAMLRLDIARDDAGSRGYGLPTPGLPDRESVPGPEQARLVLVGELLPLADGTTHAVTRVTGRPV